jgi:hypothetical protein
MSTPIPATATADEPRPIGRRRPIKRPHKIQPALLYAALLVGLALIAIVGEFIVHATTTEPRDTLAIAARELRVNTLAPGERVVHAVAVFHRSAVDYFRATRGVLVLTDRRLVYLGVQPRDLLAAADVPPTFEERDFPIDTLVRLGTTRTAIGLSHALAITSPNQSLTLGVGGPAWPRAKLLITAMDVRHDRALAEGVRQGKLRSLAEAERRAVEATRRQPKYYAARRGDALASIALIWNTTPDRLRQWNKLPDNRIRVGQTIMVKPQT